MPERFEREALDDADHLMKGLGEFGAIRKERSEASISEGLAVRTMSDVCSALSEAIFSGKMLINVLRKIQKRTSFPKLKRIRRRVGKNREIAQGN